MRELLNDPATGNWTLTISDNNPGNGGTLTGWTLELCTLNALPATPVSLTTLAPTAMADSADIDLLWLDKSDNETGFEIERARGRQHDLHQHCHRCRQHHLLHRST